jgi:hypothetical protein
MNRPYHVVTPRNIYGESLVGPSIHNPPYTIRSVYDRGLALVRDKDFERITKLCLEMNDAHEVHLAYAMHI